MQEDQKFNKILSEAMNLLSYRDHFAFELQKKLQRKFPKENNMIQLIIERLQDSHLINDKNYIQNYIEYRSKTSPRGKNMLRQELRLRGLDLELVDQVFDEIEFDEYEFCRKAGFKKKLSFDHKIHQDKQKDKLYRFLASRGFDFSVVREVVESLIA